jgi:3-hydroxybutyryl-CoA dehydrogenase
MAIDAVPVCAVGAGRMGRGIALAFAAAGHRETLVDLKPRVADALARLEVEARAEIASDLAFLVAVGAIDAAGAEAAGDLVGFAGRDDAPEVLASAGLIFEGVPETLEAKRECFTFVSDHVSDYCIVTSTSSTIDPDLLAPMVAGPERFLNAHWLNPAHLMPLVELSPTAATAPDVLARTRAILEAIGKVPIVCKGLGYVVPRIQALAMNEAARMVEEGVASAEDIDTAIRVGFGLRFSVLGMLEFIDWGGGDILHYASAFLAEHIDRGRFTAPEIIGRNMELGRRGLRDGAGFYDYEGIDTAAYRTDRLTDFVSMLRQRNLMPHFRSGDA